MIQPVHEVHPIRSCSCTTCATEHHADGVGSNVIGWAKMSTVSFGTGGAKPVPYPTYHTTKDDLDLITPEIMEDLARLTFLATVELANR